MKPYPLDLSYFDPYRSFIPRFDDFVASLHLPIPTYLRTNTLRIRPEKLAKIFKERGISLIPVPSMPYMYEAPRSVNPGRLFESLLGYFYVQTLTSSLAVSTLSPSPGDFICDLCAGPGGKTTHMAQSMGNKGLIVANDSIRSRLSPLIHHLKALGITNVITTCYDGQSFPMKCRFDRVLVDAPCSGEGNWRVQTDGTLRRFIPRKGNLPRLQKGLLLRSFDLLKEGGRLLYATCTYDPEENEGVVNELLRRRPARLLPIEPIFPHSVGLTEWKGDRYEPSLERCCRIYPHQLNAVGFFMALAARG